MQRVSAYELEKYNKQQIIRYCVSLHNENDRLMCDVVYLRTRLKLIDIYRKRAHTYKVEMERCRRKLTKIYKNLHDIYYCDFGDKDGAKRFVKDWKNV